MVKIVLNSEGIRELLRSEEVSNECKKHADSVQARCGSDYTTESRTYPERRGYAVYPTTARGRNDNMKNNTLLKALR